MTTKQLFSSTMPFVRAKLALGAAMVAICALLLGLFIGIGWLFGDTGMVIGFCIWLPAVRVVRLALEHYTGYLLKAGHVAVIAEACYTGAVPDNQLDFGKAAVTERFTTANVYFAVDKLVTGAVKEIQKSIGKLGDKLNFVPGMEAVTGAAQFFISIFLGYIDECCLGWTFYKREQGTFQSAADAVVIYAQNWKELLKNAGLTMVKVIAGTALAVLVIFIPIGLLFKLLKWSGFLAFVLACLVAWIVKYAILDSYIMIEMMGTYMALAPDTVLRFDLYKALAELSDEFKELWQKGREDAKQYAYTQNSTEASVPAPVAPASDVSYCGQCGTPNKPGTRFCGNCGQKL